LMAKMNSWIASGCFLTTKRVYECNRNKKVIFHRIEFIFQMHNPGEPLTPVSVWDSACIVQAGFRKFYMCCHREDAGIQKESRPGQWQDQTSTLFYDNTPTLFSRGCCAGVLIPGNKPRIFYTPWCFLLSGKWDKKY
jgi:hypothetical protein